MTYEPKPSIENSTINNWWKTKTFANTVLLLFVVLFGVAAFLNFKSSSGLFLSLSTNLLSSFIVINAYDSTMKRREKISKIRKDVASNLRFSYKLIKNHYRFVDKNDLDDIEHDISFFDKRWPARIKYFLNSEKDLIHKIMNENYKLKQLVSNAIIDVPAEIKTQRLDELYAHIITLRNLNDKLTDLIWKTEKPDKD